MSTYKVIDSTISILYCAKCANEFLEVVPPNRLVCRDCGMVTSFDPTLIRVGQLKGTKYKMRDKRRYSFREIADEAREDAFKEVFIPSPEPGRRRIGWKDEAEETEAEEADLRMAGVDDNPRRGWRSKNLMNTLSEDESMGEEASHDSGRNGAEGSVCAR